ncbi:MAG: hypothetical protein IJA08_03115 [Clostridia bacterium]|nr:hypothetical protein [Clostridia bacterium]
MYEYKIGLALVKDISNLEKGLDKRKDFILSQIKLFNEKSLCSAINPKHIGLGEKGEDTISITRTTLIITLYTQQVLNNPGKAIRLLSQLLITSNDTNNLSDLILGKKLFRSFKVATSNTPDEAPKLVDVSKISNSDLIKALVDYVCNQQDFSAKKLNAIEEIKKIAVESGLL